MTAISGGGGFKGSVVAKVVAIVAIEEGASSRCRPLAASSASTHTTNLPPEMLSKVFRVLVDSSLNDGEIMQNVAKITGVSRKWREIIHKTPVFRETSLLFRVRGLVNSIRFHPSKIQALTVIAVFSKTIGQKVVSESCLSKAERMISTRQRLTYARYSSLEIELEYIAKAKAKLGMIEDAKKTANRIFTANDRVKVKADIGDIVGAKVDATSIGCEYSRAQKDIAMAQIKHGDIAGAKETVLLISHDLFKSTVIRDVAMHLFKQNGDVNKLIDSVKELSDTDEKNGFLGSIVQVLAKSGKIKEAKQLTEEINDQTEKVASEIAIAEFHVEEKDIKRIEESLSTYGLKDIPIIKFSLLKVQLKRGIESGDIEGAKVLANGCKQCYKKYEALLAVIQWCIERDNIKAAMAMAEIISSGDASKYTKYTKDVALRLLAGAYARRGNFSAAADAIDDISSDGSLERIKAEFEVYRIREEREEREERDREKILAAE